MEQRVENIDFRELLLLAYFKSKYKSYDYSEAVKVLGITYIQLKKIIEKLEENGYLIRTPQCYVISKEGELLLEKEKMTKIFEQTEKKHIIDKWNPEKPYIPKGFRL